MSTREDVVSIMYHGRVIDVFKKRVILSNGVTTELDIVRHPGASAIVPVLNDGRIVMIRQYRYVVGEFLWEIPAGTLEAGEDPLECAKRELLEEVGYEAVQYDKIGEIVPVPGYSDERIHLFIATGLEKRGQKLEEDEILEVAPLMFSELVKMIKEGKIKDAKTISALLLTQQLNLMTS